MYLKSLGKWVDIAALSHANFAVIVATELISAIDGPGPIEERSPGDDDLGVIGTTLNGTLPSCDGFSGRNGHPSRLSESFGVSN